MEKPKLTYYTVKAGNCKTGTTKSGKPYVNVGLVIKSGPKAGTWLNYFKIVTDKTKPYLKKDLEVMGVEEVSPFKSDNRVFSVGVGYDEYWKEDRVQRVYPSKFPEKGTPDDDIAF